MQNYVENMWCYFSVLDQKNPIWANLIKKIKIVSLSWNLVPRLICIYGIQWRSLFLFLTINIVLGQIWSKNSKLFKVKFDTKANLNMQNSMMMFTFSVFDLKYLFWANLVHKIKIVRLSWNFALDEFEYPELCRKYVLLTFSVLDQKNPFWSNLVKKIKNVSLSWNLVPRVIWKCRIHWWCSLFWFLTRNTFRANLAQKIEIVSFSWNFALD